MATFGLVEYKDATPEVRAVYDDIMATRKTDSINNFWAGAAKKGITDRMLHELMAVVALANANVRLANGYQIDVE